MYMYIYIYIHTHTSLRSVGGAVVPGGLEHDAGLSRLELETLELVLYISGRGFTLKCWTEDWAL